MWLKRRTPQNIVIGGAAGAMPPLVGWAAVTGGLDGMALYLFAIVFFWTPPHFWALSLLMKDEYERVGVPMLPVVRGEDETRRQILLYTRAALRGHPAALLRRRPGDDLPRRLVRARRRCSSAAPSLLYRRADRRSALRLYLFSLALPRPAVRRDGRRRQACRIRPAMDRNLARKNIRSGLIATAVCFFMFGMTFVAAAIYIS